MTYTVIKTIKGRRYRYEQRTWREGKHIRTQSDYIGPVGGGGGRGRSTKSALKKVGEFIERQGPLFSAMDKYEEQAAKQSVAQQQDRAVARDAAMAQMHDLYGMKAPTYDDMGHVAAVDKDATQESGNEAAPASPDAGISPGSQS